MITHYTTADAVVSRQGVARAVCGRLVNERHGETDDQHPTCPRCAAWLAQQDDEPLPAWAQEGVRR